MTAPWEYRDPLEAKLAAEVSAPTLMEHVRTIGAWERESGSAGEAQAFDYIERSLKSYGLEVVAPTRVSDNILGYTWAKHVYGALLVATAVVDAHVYEVVERSPEVQGMLIALVMESVAVAEAAGIRLEPFDEYDPADYRAAARGDVAARERAMTVIASHYRAHTKTKTGIWRDLAVRRRKTEVGALLGATVTKATRLGLAMPLTERLIAMIADLEAGRRVMTWDNVDELVRHR